MNNIIQSALKAVSNVSVESSAGLELALDKIDALNPELPTAIQRTALIEVIEPALVRHPVDTTVVINALHSPLHGYSDVFASQVAPTVGNLFLFQ